MDPHRPKHIANEQFVIDMFKYMDKNQDGFVSKAEIKTYADKYGATLLGPKGQALFDKIDASDDEKISMEGKKLNSFFNNLWLNPYIFSEIVAYLNNKDDWNNFDWSVCCIFK